MLMFLYLKGQMLEAIRASSHDPILQKLDILLLTATP